MATERAASITHRPIVPTSTTLGPIRPNSRGAASDAAPKAAAIGTMAKPAVNGPRPSPL